VTEYAKGIREDGLTFLTIFLNDCNANLEYLICLCGVPCILIKLLKARLSIVMTSSLGPKPSILVNSTHLQIEGNKGGICKLLKNGKQLAFVFALVYLHDCCAMMADALVDVVGGLVGRWE
jgi:hypothetical protein